jgi:hypothetical protein
MRGGSVPEYDVRLEVGGISGWAVLGILGRLLRFVVRLGHPASLLKHLDRRW